MPEADTIWTFRDALTRATIGDSPAIAVLFRACEAALTTAGFLVISGQVSDATIISTPKQRNTDGEKADTRAERIPEGLEGEADQARTEGPRRPLDGRVFKARPSDNGSPRIDIAVPSFGYNNDVGIDQHQGLIRTWTATHAACHDGAQLPNMFSRANTASDVWTDTGYRSKANVQHLADAGLRSLAPSSSMSSTGSKTRWASSRA